VYRNEVPASEYERMRCPHQRGDFPAPVAYGYAIVGEVVAGPPDLQGRSVFVLHPHQDRFVVQADAAIPIPPAVPPARAVLAANMETALNGLWDADVRAGDRVCVLGAGVVGLLVAWLSARIPGVELTLVDPDPRKRDAAAALDLTLSTAPPDADGARFDRVIEASGNTRALATALTLAGFEASIVVLSWYGTRTASLGLGGGFHSGRLRLLCSQVGSVAEAQRSRWSHRRRLSKALELLADDRLEALITSEATFEQLPDTMASIDAGAETLCHRVRY
jgi:threonine dehydrogenase-like Zn-dependent dehydrogenase